MYFIIWNDIVKKTYWHFVANDKKLRYGDNRQVRVGRNYRYKPRYEGQKVQLCMCGMHASERILDAIKYAPGFYLCSVELNGDIQFDNSKMDKVVAENRKVLTMKNVRKPLEQFLELIINEIITDWNTRFDYKIPQIILEFLKTKKVPNIGDGTHTIHTRFTDYCYKEFPRSQTNEEYNYKRMKFLGIVDTINGIHDFSKISGKSFHYILVMARSYFIGSSPNYSTDKINFNNEMDLKLKNIIEKYS